MFNKQTITTLAIVSVAILVLLLYLNRINRNQYDWTETYQVESKQPYGAYAMHELMQGYFSDNKFENITNLAEQLPEETDEVANYAFLGYGLYLDSTRAKQLLKFVENGNNALIIARHIPPDLISDYMFYEECELDYYRSYDGDTDSSKVLSLVHPQLKERKKFTYQQQHKARFTEWQYIDWVDYCYEEPNYLNLGYMNDTLANFVRIPYGDGYFYLHTNPMIFGNINLINKENRAYVNQVLAHLDEGDIYWDKENRILSPPPRIDEVGYDDSVSPDRAAFSGKTPLQYILSERSLAWAWYLLLASALLYVFFRAKRKQRIIPVVEPNTNTSLEFVETIGMLHWQQNDHRQLALQQMKLFSNHVNARYHIPLKQISTSEKTPMRQTVSIDEKNLKRLSTVSDISPAHFENIFEKYNKINEQSAITDKELIAFHQLLEHFYKNSK